MAAEGLGLYFKGFLPESWCGRREGRRAMPSPRLNGRDLKLPRPSMAMAGKTSNSMRFLYAISLPLVRATCYNVLGREADLIPCNPDDDISPCCSENDYCLSNGLCLDATANNLMSIQGCTDSVWRNPCPWIYCKTVCMTPLSRTLRGWTDLLDDEKTHDPVEGFALFPCGETLGDPDSEGIRYCCQTDWDTCCSKQDWYSVPVGTVVRGPVTRSTAGTHSTSGTTTHTGSEKTSSLEASSPSGNADTNSGSGARKIGLGVGLGVGLPVVLALAGILTLLVKRKRNVEHTAEHHAVEVTAHGVQSTKHELPAVDPLVEMPTHND